MEYIENMGSVSMRLGSGRGMAWDGELGIVVGPAGIIDRNFAVYLLGCLWEIIVNVDSIIKRRILLVHVNLFFPNKLCASCRSR